MAKSKDSWQGWEPDARLELLSRLQRHRWICDRAECDGLEHEGWQLRHARTAQRPPDGLWRCWYLQGGRGSGKSRTGAETLKDLILGNEPGEWAIIAPTYADARDVCVESPGGVLAALGGTVANWNRSTGQVQLHNGSVVFLDGADDGAFRIQGKNLRGAWCDEVGLWGRGWKTAWMESLQFAVRLAPGKIVATGTPKAGHPLIKHLLADPYTRVTRMRTMDNSSNLDPMALEELKRQYAGSRLGRQELEAEFLEDIEGALWSRTQLDDLRVGEPPELSRVLVAVDPNVSSNEASNSAGIVVVGRGKRDGLGYVIADRTTAGGPRAWAQAAIAAYHFYEADLIVAEKNQGGEMVRITIETVLDTAPIKLVHASHGKRIRAEPIATLYEGDAPRVRHCRSWKGAPVDLQALEDQMVTWTPEADSPDRMDALVWGLSELMLGRTYGPARILNPNSNTAATGYGDWGAERLGHPTRDPRQ